MIDAITGCAERTLTPPARKDQSAINLFCEMSDARDKILCFLDQEEYRRFFGDEITSFLADVSWKVYEEGLK